METKRIGYLVDNLKTLEEHAHVMKIAPIKGYLENCF